MSHPAKPASTPPATSATRRATSAFTLEVDGQLHDVTVDVATRKVVVDGVEFALDGAGTSLPGNGTAIVADRVRRIRIESVVSVHGPGAGAAGGAVKVRPPMTGRLESLRVAIGDTVAKGQVLFVLEAMKMQNEVKSPAAGTVSAIHLAAGATLETSQVVMEIQAGA